MRMAFGLVGLLVTVAIMVWLFASFWETVIAIPPLSAHDQMQQLAGQTDDGGNIQDDQLTANRRQDDGKLVGFTVTNISIDSPMRKKVWVGA